MFLRSLLLVLLLPFSLVAQEDSTTTGTPYGFFRIRFENDFFTATDHYYSQGVGFEFAHPGLRKNPLNKILVHGSDDAGFSCSFNTQAFTPTSILSDSILYGDRPYAGIIYAGFTRYSFHAPTHTFITSELRLGVIGPAAQGYEIQKFIHVNTSNPIPHGWEYQIANDVLIGYSLKLEQNFLDSRFVELHPTAELNAGTVYDNLHLGLKTRIGRLRNNRPANKGFLIWLSGSVEGVVVGYNATLQGGLFNDASPYVIATGYVSRVVAVYTAGAVVQFGKVQVKFFDTRISREFKDGLGHAWGHIGVKVAF